MQGFRETGGSKAETIKIKEGMDMGRLKDDCVAPTKGPIIPEGGDRAGEAIDLKKGGVDMLVRVGKEAVDFETSAYIEGYGFKPVKLSDYKGKWIVICFYPGDFTFV